jgi:hypothetical protein
LKGVEAARFLKRIDRGVVPVRKWVIALEKNLGRPRKRFKNLEKKESRVLRIEEEVFVIHMWRP